jgi:hypothetical protein
MVTTTRPSDEALFAADEATQKKMVEHSVGAG